MYTKNAFTLAEVLVTLGIIGVVAALTIPSLTNKVPDQKHMAALKKNIFSSAAGYKSGYCRT